MKFVSIFTIFLFVSCASVNEKKIYGVSYMQNAAEVVALQLQVYNQAKNRLDFLIRNKKIKKNSIIVVDVDETVLDNSPYEARNILESKSYPDGWRDWVNKASARDLPGALDFLKYADKKGVKTFYITNRKEISRKETLQNLKMRGFPVSNDRLILRTAEYCKKSRRELVRKNYDIIMLFGDNLSDFTDEFTQKKGAKRADIVLKYKDLFGKKYFILPNSMYGDWAKGKTPKEKLIGF